MRPPRDSIGFDRASVRSYDADGHLHVASSIISAAQINPYLGREIPGAEGLGLDPNRKYMLLRDPAELEAGTQTFHGKPLLIQHKALTAGDHDREMVIGSVINPKWEAPNIIAELVVWDADAIKLIESGDRSDLSCGYRFTAEMDPGMYHGKTFDGRMVNIIGNHCALVVDGRVSGAQVADRALEYAMAFDQREDGDPLNEVENALQACESWIAKNVTDELQRARGLELVKEYGRATNAAGRAGHKLGEDRRRFASDERTRPSSILDRVLAGVRNPSAGGLTGH